MINKNGFIRTLTEKPKWVKVCIVGGVLVGLVTVFAISTVVSQKVILQSVADEEAAAAETDVVMEKLANSYGWDIEGFADTDDKLSPAIIQERNEFNELLNSFKESSTIVGVQKELNVSFSSETESVGTVEEIKPNMKGIYTDSSSIHFDNSDDFDEVSSIIEDFYSTKGYDVVKGDGLDVENVEGFSITKTDGVGKKDPNNMDTNIIGITVMGMNNSLAVRLTYTSPVLPLSELPVLDGFETNYAEIPTETFTGEDSPIKPGDTSWCELSPENPSAKNFWLTEYGCPPE